MKSFRVWRRCGERTCRRAWRTISAKVNSRTSVHTPAERALLELMVGSRKHPVLQPGDHWVSWLIIQHSPLQTCRGGSNSGQIKKEVLDNPSIWLRAYNEFRCVVCREVAGKLETQVIADLPPNHLAPFTSPFHFTSCAYFGVYHMKIGRHKTT